MNNQQMQTVLKQDLNNVVKILTSGFQSGTLAAWELLFHPTDKQKVAKITTLIGSIRELRSQGKPLT